MPRTDIPIIGKPTPALLVIRLRNAEERYEQIDATGLPVITVMDI